MEPEEIYRSSRRLQGLVLAHKVDLCGFVICIIRMRGLLHRSVEILSVHKAKRVKTATREDTEQDQLFRVPKPPVKCSYAETTREPNAMRIIAC